MADTGENINIKAWFEISPKTMFNTSNAKKAPEVWVPKIPLLLVNLALKLSEKPYHPVQIILDDWGVGMRQRQGCEGIDGTNKTLVPGGGHTGSNDEHQRHVIHLASGVPTDKDFDVRNSKQAGSDTGTLGPSI